MILRDVTLVIPAHGHPDLLARLLDGLEEAVAAAADLLRVIVSDDASPEPLEAATAGHRPHLEVTYVRDERNGGPGAARNRALGGVSTTWVAFLDADMVAGESWIRRLVEVVRESAADGVEGRVEVRDESVPTPFTHATEFSTAGVHHGAGNVVYRTDRLREAGGFDERFYDPVRRLHFREDTELHLRLLAGRAEVVYDPDLVAAHPPLPASYLAPLRLARRYHFDPLLASLHPEGFAAMNDARRIGPLNLRRARHDAAVATVAGSALLAVGLLRRSRPAALAGATVAAAGWGATAVALAWRRQVRAAHVAPLAAVSYAVPWVYVWHYYRGVVRFRHRPRL